jgi:hypothetical protein
MSVHLSKEISFNVNFVSLQGYKYWEVGFKLYSESSPCLASDFDLQRFYLMLFVTTMNYQLKLNLVTEYKKKLTTMPAGMCTPPSRSRQATT